MHAFTMFTSPSCQKPPLTWSQFLANTYRVTVLDEDIICTSNTRYLHAIVPVCNTCYPREVTPVVDASLDPAGGV